MSKEKEIAEIENFIAKNKTVETSEWLANGLYNMGYRRADEVRKETAKEILQWLYNLCKGGFSLDAFEVRQIAKEHGVEVDE